MSCRVARCEPWPLDSPFSGLGRSRGSPAPWNSSNNILIVWCSVCCRVFGPRRCRSGFASPESGLMAAGVYVCWLRRRLPALHPGPNVPLRSATAPLGWLADGFGWFCRIHGFCADDGWNGSGAGGHLPAGPGRSPVNCTPWNSSNYIVIVCFFWSPPGMPLRLCHRCSNNFVCVAYGGWVECLLAQAPLARAAPVPACAAASCSRASRLARRRVRSVLPHPRRLRR